MRRATSRLGSGKAKTHRIPSPYHPIWLVIRTAAYKKFQEYCREHDIILDPKEAALKDADLELSLRRAHDEAEPKTRTGFRAAKQRTKAEKAKADREAEKRTTAMVTAHLYRKIMIRNLDTDKLRKGVALLVVDWEDSSPDDPVLLDELGVRIPCTPENVEEFLLTSETDDDGDALIIPNNCVRMCDACVIPIDDGVEECPQCKGKVDEFELPYGGETTGDAYLYLILDAARQLETLTVQELEEDSGNSPSGAASTSDACTTSPTTISPPSTATSD